jgi:hypothetical protein
MITNQDIQALRALYYGQEVVLMHKDSPLCLMDGTLIHCLGATLKLKKLEDITYDVMKQLITRAQPEPLQFGKFRKSDIGISLEYTYNAIKGEQGWPVKTAYTIQFDENRLNVSEYQILIANGYALGWRGYSVKELVLNKIIELV